MSNRQFCTEVDSVSIIVCKLLQIPFNDKALLDVLNKFLSSPIYEFLKQKNWETNITSVKTSFGIGI